VEETETTATNRPPTTKMEIRNSCLVAAVTQVTLCDLCELCGEKQRLRSKRGGKGNELASAVNLFTTVAGVVESAKIAVVVKFGSIAR
jgi:hypothetical protein